MAVPCAQVTSASELHAMRLANKYWVCLHYELPSECMIGTLFVNSVHELLLDCHTCLQCMQVVRCFEDTDVHHVNGKVDPAEDSETINFELALADVAQIEKRLERLKKGRAKSKEEQASNEVSHNMKHGRPHIYAHMYAYTLTNSLLTTMGSACQHCIWP